MTRMTLTVVAAVLLLELLSASSLYTVTWQSSMWVNRQASVTRDTFTPGDRLVVIAAPF